MLTVKDNSLLEWDPIKAKLNNKLGDMVQYFQVDQPQRGDGLPMAYVDAAALTGYMLEAEEPDDIPDTALDAALVPIESCDGIPTTGTGVPLWERLDGEPIPYYKMFTEYREMKYTDLQRSISKLSEASQMPAKHLNALSKCYHWQLRVKAYDKYKEQQKQLARQYEIEKLETRHSAAAKQLIEQAVDYLLMHPEQLSPKTALQMYEIATKHERLALGLDPTKPFATAGGGKNAPGVSVNIMNNQAVGGEITATQATPGALSEAHAKTVKQTEDPTHMAGIINALNQSGAFTGLTPENPTVNGDDADDFIDCDYEEVD